MTKSDLLQDIIILCLVLFSVPYFILALDEPIETSTGPIIGTVFTYGDVNVQAYLGIPFAEPPVGNLRFKRTVAKKSWLCPFRATKFAPGCPQHQSPKHPMIDTMPNLSEDCLYLNIWVPPETRADSKKAVMIWLYSGGFTTGSNRLPVYNGDVLAAEGDVILVTVNYRLGILGYLSSTSDEAPGNMGFYDMCEAMKWVKTNIAAFGGDGDNVTLFGQGGGAIAVGLMCLSPLAEGLFNRAILQSGTPAYLNRDNTDKNARLAQEVAKAVGCCASDVNNYTENPDAAIECLRTKDAQELIEVTTFLNKGKFLSIVGDDFLTTDPQSQLISGELNAVDVMVGHAQEEGSFLITKTNANTFGDFGQNNPQVNKSFGTELILKAFGEFPYKECVVSYYLGDLEEYDYDCIREQTYHSIGDYMVFCQDMYFAECYADRGQNVFAYYFNHVPSVTPWAPWMRSTHFDEVPFVFGRPLDQGSEYTDAEQFLAERLIRIWTNFAKTGFPGENWEKFSRANQYFKVLNIYERKTYLEKHKNNCEFFRPLVGF